MCHGCCAVIIIRFPNRASGGDLSCCIGTEIYAWSGDDRLKWRSLGQEMRIRHQLLALGQSHCGTPQRRCDARLGLTSGSTVESAPRCWMLRLGAIHQNYLTSAHWLRCMPLLMNLSSRSVGVVVGSHDDDGVRRDGASQRGHDLRRHVLAERYACGLKAIPEELRLGPLYGLIKAVGPAERVAALVATASHHATRVRHRKRVCVCVIGGMMRACACAFYAIGGMMRDIGVGWRTPAGG